MKREELIVLVEKIQSLGGTAKEIDEMIHNFLRNVPDPEALDYIFQKEYENLSTEEIVDKALSYTIINL